MKRIPYFLALTCALVTGALHAAETRPPVGTNLARIDDWSTDFPLVDIFKTSRAWVSGTAGEWSDSQSIDLDKHGWVQSLQPGQVVRTLMLSDPTKKLGNYLAGRYVVEYEGDGTLEYGGGARKISSSPKRDVVELLPSANNGIHLAITATTRNNHLRNIRVYREGADPARNIFVPEFLERLKNYKAIRFMDWMATNGNWRRTGGSAQRRWEDRPKAEDARWSGTHGAPLEIMAKLANTLRTDAWFNMPHLADDDYVRNFAQTAFRLLDPGVRVYVEYSNEVWNEIFAQAGYAREQGLAQRLSSNPREAQIRFHAKRSAEIFAIWAGIFPKERLVRVLASQATNPWVSETALSYANVAASTDALAIAPYFGIRNDDIPRVRDMNLDDFMRELENTALPRAKDAMSRQFAISKKHRIPLVAYEAGQHLVGAGKSKNDETLNALFDAANRDRRMGGLYTRYMKDWMATGAGLMVHFQHCAAYRKFNRFGSLEYMTQPRSEAPKYDAIQRFIEGR